MAGRIRTLKPEWLEDEALSRLSDTARLLFLAGISLADDHGNLRASPAFLLAQAWWASAPRESIESAVAELAGAGLWLLYAANGQAYAHINGWTKHQRIDNATEPRLPLPPGWIAEKVESEDGKRRRVRWVSRIAAAANDAAKDCRGGNPWQHDVAAVAMPGCQGLSRPDPDQRPATSDQGAATPPRAAEAPAPPPPVVTLKPDAVAVRSELAKADDLWPADGLDRVAKRIADTVTDPLNRAKGEHVHVTREAIAHARTEKGKFPHATPETLLGKAEQKVGWILADYRTGKRRKDGTGPGIAPNDLDHVPIADELKAAANTIPKRIDPEPPPLTAEERQKRIAQLAARVGRGAA